MKPLRIFLEGFMCYQDKTEISFDGSKLWVLSGPNGSGKSAIFDAMTFALYGTFRGDDDRRDGRTLINHNCDSLYVEFDFEVGTDQYRVIRGLSRKKTSKSIFRAIHLSLPAGSNGEIKEVKDKDSLRNWVIRTIGLDKEAFVTSVLLRQGQADTLLNMKADSKKDSKKDIVKQLVNIGAYEKLFIEADNARKKYYNEAKDYERQLGDLEKVTADDLTQIEAELRTAEASRDAIGEQLKAIAGLQVSSMQWQSLQKQKDDLLDKLAEIKTLLAQAAQIETRASRRRELDQVVPILLDIWKARQDIIKAEEEVSDNKAKAEKYSSDANEAICKLDALERTQTTLKANKQQTEEGLQEVNQKQLQLSKPSHELDELDRCLSIVESLEHEIATYPSQLDQEVEQARLEKERLDELDRALSWLRVLNDQCQQWQLARQSQTTLKDSLDDLQNQLGQIQKVKEGLEQEQESAGSTCGKARQNVADVKAELKTIEEQLARFEEVDGQPKCSYCGQDLTADHLDTERARLNEALNLGNVNLRQAELEFEQAASQKTKLDKDLQRVIQQIQQLEKNHIAENGKLDQSIQREISASVEAARAYNTLPESYQHKVHPGLGFTLETCTTFPSQEELAVFTTELNNLKAAKNNLARLENFQKERDKKLTELKGPTKRLSELQKEYPPEQVARIRQQLIELEQTSANLTKQLNSARDDLSRVDGDIKSLQEQIKEWSRLEQDLRLKAGNLAGQLQTLQQNVSQAVTKLGDTWQPVAVSLTLVQLEELETEQKSLAAAFEEHQKLLKARNNETNWNTQLEQADNALNQIPEAARRPVAELEAEEDRLNLSHQEGGTRVKNLVAHQTTIANTLESRRSLDEKRQTAAQEANLYKRLATYLNADNIQQWLLKEAQTAIVVNANQVLERISGGTLQLDFNETEDDGDMATGKVLDLVVHNSDTNAHSLSAELLSGSQRFRVAVSLALGIGQYASHRAQPIQSIIIDEGFGSLDKNGRDEIIEELNRLQTLMERIILVSHQEEFFTRFNHGWSFQLENGVTKAELV
jgi:DNA repair protein SbcC/Rad50